MHALDLFYRLERRMDAFVLLLLKKDVFLPCQTPFLKESIAVGIQSMPHFVEQT